MYVQMGQDYVLKAESIVALLDLDTASYCARTRNMLARLEKEGKVIDLTTDLPRSAILSTDALGERLFLLSLSAKTMKERLSDQTHEGAY